MDFPGTRNLLSLQKQFLVNGFQFGQHFRFAVAPVDYADVNGVSNGPVHHAYGYFAPVLPPYALLSKVVAKAERPIALMNIFLKNQLDDFGVLRHDYEVTHILVFLIHAARSLRSVAE